MMNGEKPWGQGARYKKLRDLVDGSDGQRGRVVVRQELEWFVPTAADGRLEELAVVDRTYRHERADGFSGRGILHATSSENGAGDGAELKPHRPRRWQPGWIYELKFDHNWGQGHKPMVQTERAA